MDDTHDFTALRSLIASARVDMPRDTQVDEFLIEFHRRQRSQLLAPRSAVSRCAAWLRERASRLEWAPSLSYGGVAAAIALTAFIGFSQDSVTGTADSSNRFSFRMPMHEASFAMAPGALVPFSTFSPKLSDSQNFATERQDATATRYVLANNSPGASDATVAF